MRRRINDKYVEEFLKSVKSNETYVNSMKWRLMESNKKPILLFEIGILQVYHFQTQEDYEANKKYTEVYWRHKVTLYTYGPFPTIDAAVTHHEYTMSKMNVEDAKNVVYVNFQTKKRIANK